MPALRGENFVYLAGLGARVRDRDIDAEDVVVDFVAKLGGEAK